MGTDYQLLIKVDDQLLILKLGAPFLSFFFLCWLGGKKLHKTMYAFLIQMHHCNLMKALSTLQCFNAVQQLALLCVLPCILSVYLVF